MQEVQPSDKDIGYPYDMKVFIIMHFSGVPGNNEHRKSHNNGKKLYKSMEEHIAVLFTKIKDNDQATDCKACSVVVFKQRK